MGFEIRMKRRREDRIEVVLPVRIFGIDSQGKPFNIRTETVDVTRLGARLHGVNCFSKAGEVVGLQYEEKKARFRVCWIGLPGTPKEGDIGVQLMESDKPIWDIVKIRSMPGAKKQESVGEQLVSSAPNIAPGLISDPRERLMIPAASASAGTSLFSVHSSPQGAASSRTETARPAPQPEIMRGYDAATDARSDSQPPQSSDGRRQHSRQEIKGGVEVHQAGIAQPYWGHIGDISHGGIYVQIIQPLPVDTFVNILIRAEGLEIRSAALVRTSHPLVGMGLCFAEMDFENREKLNTVLDKLENRISGPNQQQQQQQSRPNAIFMPPRGEKEKNGQPAASPTVQDELQLSQRLHEVASELRTLEQALSQARVDARLQRNFRESSDFTRQAAWAVQHFIEFQLTGRDPFVVFQQLDANRMKVLTELCRAASLDVDSKQIETEGEGIVELFRVVEALYTRLSRMYRKEAPPVVK
jgi:hypothetical protein